MKYRLLAIILASVPMIASAHTRWFAENPTPLSVNPGPTAFYLSVWAGVIILIVTLGAYFEKKGWFAFTFLDHKKPHAFERASATFAMVSGAFLIVAGTHSYIFSPNLTAEAGIPVFIIYSQIVLGFGFLLGVASRTSGVLLAILWGSLFFFIDPILVIENIWVLSTAVFLALMGNEYFAITSFSVLRSVVAPYKKYALSILRVGTGATLMILGLSEKIMAPELGLNFLSLHSWNFMEKLGLPFSDYLFTLSAGSVELLFGLVFVLGIVTRLNALAVSIVFLIPLFILGPIELTGHLPHFAAVILLLLFGGGGHFSFFSDKKYR